jgi:hypothetical protein
MMPDGHILCTLSPQPNDFNQDSFFHSPTYVYDYDYTQGVFTQLTMPDGQPSWDIPCYVTTMLNLPDGSILFSVQGQSQYYIYTSTRAQLTAGKPTISAVHKDSCEFMITGTLFNGISQGSSYGDDWQMATNYPIVHLKAGNKIYYARTHHWNRTGVQTGSLPDTAYFTVPTGVPNGTYQLYLSANGISSDALTLHYISCDSATYHLAVHDIAAAPRIIIYPNPVNDALIIETSDGMKGEATITISTTTGQQIKQLQTSEAKVSVSCTDMAPGIYFVYYEVGAARIVRKFVKL